MSKPFRFKQFSIQQDRCAMKIGTDGVLLGAWIDISHRPFSVLDIGAGTGLIALMLAQRSTAEVIDGIEIDEDAYEQCVDNFENAPWNDRLFCYHAGLDEFVEEIEDKYDLIVSNPPFFSEDYSSGDASRDKARLNSSLPFEELVESVSHLLSPEGYFNTIIPFKEEQNFIALAEKHKLFPQRICRVKGHADAEIKRSLLCFGFDKTDPDTEELIIEKSRHEYTEAYISLCKDFYLKM
ncbi:methyltransferase [Leptobacterium flavescens]|uniref:tRNA1(Val) (adenine(37)-N6)-methyltransferase n=1 Tax=Leptobacterium flavescens TaxID=472055 RepID=A0A6P0UKE2_9FLAO|nr:methyltransferase [Leptobacterium flavescens]NER12880.1 methyltransferase [Leptobacterium flavescens]